MSKMKSACGGKKLLFLAMLVIAVGILSGCQNAAEKAAETAIEKSTNGQADVDIDNDTATITTDDGSLEVGEDVSLPDGFPSDVYIIDGTIVSAMTLTEGESYTVSIKTDESVNSVKEEYEEELADDGWEVTMSLAIQDGFSLSATKDDRTVTLSIGTDDEETVVVINTMTTN